MPRLQLSQGTPTDFFYPFLPSKAEYDKPFAYSAELEEKLARQYELNAQLDIENAKAMDADLGGPDEEKSEDRIENAGIVAEDKGIYMPDRNRKR